MDEYGRLLLMVRVGLYVRLRFAMVLVYAQVGETCQCPTKHLRIEFFRVACDFDHEGGTRMAGFVPGNETPGLAQVQ